MSTSHSLMSESDATQSRFSWGRKKVQLAKGFKKLIAPQYLNTTTYGQVTSEVGRQAAMQLHGYVGSSGAITRGFLSSSDINQLMTLSGLDEPTPASTNLGSAFAAGSNTRRLVVEQVNAKYTFKNQTTLPIEIEIYDFVYRNDSTNILNVVDLWNGGLDNETTNAAGSLGRLLVFPGAKPFEAVQFTSEVRVGKRTHLFLHPGSNHVHRIRYTPKYPINKSQTNWKAQLSGLTFGVMLVQKGGIIKDGQAVSYGRSMLDYICEASYKYYSVSKNRTLYTAYTDLPQVVTKESAIIEDTDTVGSNAMAQ